MRYDFLKHFPKRMKHVGLYAVLLQGSLQKTTWQKYGFVRADEQINLIFAVLLDSCPAVLRMKGIYRIS